MKNQNHKVCWQKIVMRLIRFVHCYFVNVNREWVRKCLSSSKWKCSISQLCMITLTWIWYHCLTSKCSFSCRLSQKTLEYFLDNSFFLFICFCTVNSEAAAYVKWKDIQHLFVLLFLQCVRFSKVVWLKLLLLFVVYSVIWFFNWPFDHCLSFKYRRNLICVCIYICYLYVSFVSLVIISIHFGYRSSNDTLNDDVFVFLTQPTENIKTQMGKTHATLCSKTFFIFFRYLFISWMHFYQEFYSMALLCDFCIFVWVCLLLLFFRFPFGFPFRMVETYTTTTLFYSSTV